ncbi:HD domain-containing protein [Deltaproteobacteria bacterium IMCC39524]|nr:HD domain-containing protein [Deltaproteobacteria bacterium IMCC39524]
MRQLVKAVQSLFSRRSGALQSESSSADFFRGIRFRLVSFVLSLLVVTTFSVSFIVMQILDSALLDSLVKRGSAITQAAAVPAGFSLLENDRLAMDNLVAQIKASQEELVYVAILDLEKNILAHDRLDRVGEQLPSLTGKPIAQAHDVAIVRGQYEGVDSFEFRRPIYFADQHVGSVVVAVSASKLMASKALAHRQIFTVATFVTILALLGAILISMVFTRPIERLADGVSRLQKDEYVGDVPVRSRNELGMLIRNFNKMARTIQQQKASLQGYAEDLESSYNDIVRILAAALDARDNYTYGHSARVARFAIAVAERLEFTREELKELEMGCLLHDIGKIHVRDAVLNKQCNLDQEESLEIAQHPLLGSQILELAPSLHKYIPGVKHHHERFDGTGYPDRLSGDEIPLHAQILALADTYDAMTSSRPYRKGLSQEKAIAEIRRCSGSQFNPKLAEIFIDIVPVVSARLVDDRLPLESLCAS